MSEELALEKGRPRAFENAQDFEDKFRQYIQYCNIEKKLPNIAGFCVYADINRDTFYAQKDYYSDTFKKIQECLEDSALNADIGDTFRIFYLKNKFNYKDKVETENLNYEAKTYEEFLQKVNGDEY